MKSYSLAGSNQNFFKVIHLHCVLLKCCIEKQSYTRHIQVFRLLVLALLASHHQTFFFIVKNCPLKHLCVWGYDLSPFQYLS